MELDLKALCDDTGVSPRTVYFYVQQGLLPPAEGAGRGAKYSQVHRDRLRLIRQLQDQHLPLAAIRKRIDALSKRRRAPRNTSDRCWQARGPRKRRDAGRRHTRGSARPPTPLTEPRESARSGSASLWRRNWNCTCDDRSRA